jgi:hypothetical protein
MTTPTTTAGLVERLRGIARTHPILADAQSIARAADLITRLTAPVEGLEELVEIEARHAHMEDVRHHQIGFANSQLSRTHDDRGKCLQIARGLSATIASLQARLADCEGSLAIYDEGADSEYWKRYPAISRAETRSLQEELRGAREKALLEEFAKHGNWELDKGYKDENWDEHGWRVHSVTGGPNDREWTLIGFGETPAEAISTAIRSLKAQGQEKV